MFDTDIQVVSPPRHSVQHFARWVAQACPPGARVLDIGAGADLSGSLAPILDRGCHLVGIDPDASIERNRSVHERHQVCLEEFARTHTEEFDVAFAVYVLEHVADPSAFVAACSRVLRPGGSMFALTLNVRQYFGATTWAMTRLGIADPVLAWLKGRDVMDGYHFPTEYRLNSIRTVRRQYGTAGFSRVEFRCYDATERYAWYLPAPLQRLATDYTRLAYRVGSPSMMGHLSFRAVKASGGPAPV